jgi:hypothetical protein
MHQVQATYGAPGSTGARVKSSLLVFLVLSYALRDHAEGRVVETEEVSDCQKRVLVDAGGCVDPLVTCFLVSHLGEELVKARSGGEP